MLSHTRYKKEKGTPRTFYFSFSFLLDIQMPEKYKLDVPVDLSEKTTDKLELAKKILHLITGVTTLLTICVVAPLIATEAKYEVKYTISL